MKILAFDKEHVAQDKGAHGKKNGSLEEKRRNRNMCITVCHQL